MSAIQSSMDHSNEECESLVEERVAQDMVLFTGINSEHPMKRKAWFQKPVLEPNTTPSPHTYRREPITPTIQIPPKAVFKGWANPQRQWSEWVDKLKPIYFDLWKRVGISDAIQVSTYTFRKDPSSIWGLVSFWNEKTNTFIFPWGEATITLEDVMILGGLSVIGEPVRLTTPLEGELGEVESQTISEMTKFCIRKPEMSAWLRYYMLIGNADELEHVAFLALWLSRYVFPSHPVQTVKQNVIQIAIRLARGTRIALAPAVLASLYRDLRMMKDYLGGNSQDSPLRIWAPFSIHQLWIWERFSTLGPVAEHVYNNAPRAARWNTVGKTAGFSFVISVLRSSKNFRWRPYVTGSNWWKKPVFYSKDNGEYWIHRNGVGNEELGAFARFLRASELVGLTCVEQYLPHRVAMQFGLDQDIPRFVPRADSTWENGWQTYDMSKKNVRFFVPSRLSEPDVTLRYLFWFQGLQQPKTEERKRKTLLSLLPQREKKMKEEFQEDRVVPVTLNLFLQASEIAQGEGSASAPMKEEVHDNSEKEAKKLEFQQEIKKLKEEMTSIQAKVRKLISQAELNNWA